MFFYPELPDIGKIIPLFAGSKAWPSSSFDNSGIKKKRNLKR